MPEIHSSNTEDKAQAAIRDILDSNRLLTLCSTASDGSSYGNAMYFAANGLDRLIVLTAPGAAHSRFAAADPRVAGTILDTAQPFGGDLKGLQFRGSWRRFSDDEGEGAYQIYAARFPKLGDWAASAGAMEEVGMESRFFEIRVHWYKVLHELELGKEVYIEVAP